MKYTEQQLDKVHGTGAYEDFLVKLGKKQESILVKLKTLNFTNAENFVKSLDPILDADLLVKINNLTDVKLGKLDYFYNNLKRPEGFVGKIDFKAVKEVKIDGELKNITMEYKKGLPNFAPHSPTFTFANGKVSRYKYYSKSLSGIQPDFKNANEALAESLGIQKVSGQWPTNAEGFIESGNYRWKTSSQQFQLKNSQGGWDNYTWHHYEDAETLFPVRSSIHSIGEGGFNHSGGKALMDTDFTKDLRGLFKTFDIF